MYTFANPARFQRLAALLQPVLAGLTLALFAVGLYLALVASPPDYQQGESVRIMYIHVPAAWLAMFVYASVAGASAVALVWKHPLADVAAKAASPIGAVFTAVCLITGSLWGRPSWGTYWEWDARMTSVLILLFLYLGHMTMLNAFDRPERGARAAGLLAITGIVILPVIHYSVEWWNTLHQPASVMRLDAPAIDPSMLWPLFVMAFAYLGFFLTLLLIRMRAELAERRARALLIRRSAA
jgi:heme exporter protein C